MFRRALLCLIILMITALTVLAQEKDEPMTFEDQAALFNYDASVDFNVTEVSMETRDGATIHDITFISQPDLPPVTAYLVTPENMSSDDHFAGILWGHWLGEENSNRNQFLEEAVSLAPKGTVSLLVDAMWSKPGWYQSRKLDEDYQHSIEQVIAFRRAIDLLISQPNVDAERVAYVGHDYSGMYGTLAAGLDQKAKAYVFIAVTPSFFDWAFFAAEPESRVDYIRQNAVLEPIPYLLQIHNASFLFQFAREDVYVGRMKGAEFYGSAADPKELKVYDDVDHSMNTDQIRADRDAWLTEQLGLES